MPILQNDRIASLPIILLWRLDLRDLRGKSPHALKGGDRPQHKTW
ncbi:MAG: hypothetical protein V4719_02790 [Planctomycetota bacterium]